MVLGSCMGLEFFMGLGFLMMLIFFVIRSEKF
jgi:hypothetical protein